MISNYASSTRWTRTILCFAICVQSSPFIGWGFPSHKKLRLLFFIIAICCSRSSATRVLCNLKIRNWILFAGISSSRPKTRRFLHRHNHHKLLENIMGQSFGNCNPCMFRGFAAWVQRRRGGAHAERGSGCRGVGTGHLGCALQRSGVEAVLLGYILGGLCAGSCFEFVHRWAAQDGELGLIRGLRDAAGLWAMIPVAVSRAEEVRRGTRVCKIRSVVA